MEKTLINHHVLVIGAGLAGTEAAHFLAQSGVRVTLIECKRVKKNPSQKTDGFAELVCTNSLKSVVEHTGHGLLKTEMDKLGSLILTIARECQVGAGDALAVDREEFSRKCTEWIEAHPLIKVVHQEVIDPIETAKQFECDKIIIATGPLTTDHLSAWIKENLAPDDFYFYDAIAPVVDAESLNYDKLYFKDRYKDDATEADYLNAPFSKIEYEQFVKAMVEAQKVPRQHFEQERFFEACLPVDLMAERGVDTPRFSCMKPVGLEQDKKNPPYAVVQLRKENLLGSAFNLVGFQNRLTYSEQVRVFKMIPGFENASFLHLGSVHRNSFLNAKKLLNQDLSSKKYPHLFFAGQMTGVEGYTESASMGQYVAWNMVEQFKLKEFRPWPVETAIGALINYLMTSDKPSPSNINFGLLPPVTLTKEQRKNKKRKSIKKMLVAEKAQKIFDQFLEGR